MTQLYVLPTPTVLTSQKIPPDQVLEGAMGKLQCVIVIGLDTNELPYYAASMGEKADILWSLEQCKQWLLTMESNP